MRVLFLAFVVFLFSSSVWAMDIAGVTVDEQVVNEAGIPLQLNGAGIRSKFFFKIYIAELYLENTQAEAKKVIADSGAKRLVMHFIYDEVGRDKIVEGWNDGFSANNSKEKLQSLQQKIEAFNNMFDSPLSEGDEIVFDYIPGTGTQVHIKGVEKGTIEGKDFNDALLLIWLGEEPVTADLKKALLKS